MYFRNIEMSILPQPRKAARSVRFCPHCRQGRDQNAPLVHWSAPFELREEHVIKLIWDTLGSRSMSLGKLGTTMVKLTGNFELPQYFKLRFGGIRKFVKVHNAFFSLSNGHEFNPNVQNNPSARALLQKILRCAPEVPTLVPTLTKHTMSRIMSSPTTRPTPSLPPVDQQPIDADTLRDLAFQVRAGAQEFEPFSKPKQHTVAYTPRPAVPSPVRASAWVGALPSSIIGPRPSCEAPPPPPVHSPISPVTTPSPRPSYALWRTSLFSDGIVASIVARRQ